MSTKVTKAHLLKVVEDIGDRLEAVQAVIEALDDDFEIHVGKHFPPVPVPMFGTCLMDETSD